MLLNPGHQSLLGPEKLVLLVTASWPEVSFGIPATLSGDSATPRQHLAMERGVTSDVAPSLDVAVSCEDGELLLIQLWIMGGRVWGHCGFGAVELCIREKLHKPWLPWACLAETNQRCQPICLLILIQKGDLNRDMC